MMLLEMAVDGFGDRVAVGSRSGGLTYRQLFDRAGAGAAVLRQLEIERVAFVDVTGPGFPVALFAGAWAGLPFVPLNYRLGDVQLRHLLARVDPAVVIEEEREVASMSGAARCRSPAQGSSWPSSRPGPKVRAPSPAAGVATPTTSPCCSSPAAPPRRPRPRCCGTGTWLSYVLGSVEFMGADDDDAALVCVPPYHIAGVADVLSNVYAGRRIVLAAGVHARALARDGAREEQSPTPWSCRPCWPASSSTSGDADDAACRRCARSGLRRRPGCRSP